MLDRVFGDFGGDGRGRLELIRWIQGFCGGFEVAVESFGGRERLVPVLRRFVGWLVRTRTGDGGPHDARCRLRDECAGAKSRQSRLRVRSKAMHLVHSSFVSRSFPFLTSFPHLFRVSPPSRFLSSFPLLYVSLLRFSFPFPSSSPSPSSSPVSQPSCVHACSPSSTSTGA